MNYLLLGRQNVGKSSIFNILTNSNSNIVHNISGSTRDWHRKKIDLLPSNYLIDTPGIIFNNSNKIKSNPILLKLIDNVDTIIFVVDYKSVYNPIDNDTIHYLKKFNKQIVLFINKFDNYRIDPTIEYFKYNIKNVFFLSCAHNYGFERVITFIKNINRVNKKNKITFNDFDSEYSFAIFGKPNAGKSTFLNTLLGYERSQTSHKAGTTSDYVTQSMIINSKKVNFIDTAGIGRKSKIKNKSLTYYAVNKTFEKIKDVDVALILVDSFSGLDRQDKRIFNLISKQAKSLIIIFNKKDLIKDFENYKKNTLIDIKSTIQQIKNTNIFFICSFHRREILKIINFVIKNIVDKKLNIKTSDLNKWLKYVSSKNQHPLIDNKKVKFKYAVIIKNAPLTVKIFSNYSKRIQSNYRRFLINNLNSKFKIYNQNTKIVFSKSKNPFK